jgi:DNA repair protein RadC
MKNEHDGHRERMRQRYVNGGLSGFAPHEMLELLLFFAIPRKNVNSLAHSLYDRFGSLTSTFSASMEALQEVEGISKSSALLISLIDSLSRQADLEQLGNRPYMRNLREASVYCKHLFANAAEERFYVICIDAQGRVLRAVMVFSGTIDEITIYPREVVNAAFRYNAHAVVLAHNHPSGVLEPSKADLQTTEQLSESFKTIGVLLQDHIIYADGQCLSFSQWRKTQEIRPVYEQGRAKAADTNRPKKPREPKG